MVERETTLTPRNKDRIEEHTLQESPGAQNRSTFVSEGSSLCLRGRNAGKGWNLRLRESVAAQEFPNKRCCRFFADLRRGTDLLDSAGVHHHNLVCYFKRFILIVRDKERCNF